MKRYYFLVLVVLYFAFATGVPADSSKGDMFYEYVLIDAFEKGRSLVIVEILSVRKQERIYGTKPISIRCYKAKIIRPIILGDLTRDDLQYPVELFSGASYGDVLKPGSTYALFIIKDCPYNFSWAHRDDTIRIDISDTENLNSLIKSANAQYAKTLIRKFREGIATGEATTLFLPDGIIFLCESFRTNPINRAKVAKKIRESEFGSRRDESKPWSSIISYLPPIISLSREQMLSLLGKPRLKLGWTYLWFCGEDKSISDSEKYVGIVSVTFDKFEKVVRLLYYTQERVKWARFRKKNSGRTKLSGGARTVMLRFQQALKESDWDKALGFCSENVKSKASDYGSAEAFFGGIVPVDEIVSLPRFQTSGGKYNREGQQVEFRCFLRIPTVGSKETVDWVWRVGKSDSGWVIDFETISLRRHIEKERLRRLQEKERARERLEELQRGLEVRLVPLSKEFVVGEPMLFRLEMTNVSKSPIRYMGTSSVMVNDPMNIKGPDGNLIPYVDTSYQTIGRDEEIKPGETVILSEEYDVALQYGIIELGRYTFQFKGFEPCGIRSSNIVEIDVKPGELSPADSIVERLLTVLPEGWEFTRTLVSRKPTAESPSNACIIVNLIGERRRKTIDEGIGLLILVNPTEDEIALEPEWFAGHPWGRCKWGPVYVQAFDAELLWPDYREQIAKALGIEEIRAD